MGRFGLLGSFQSHGVRVGPGDSSAFWVAFQEMHEVK